MVYKEMVDCSTGDIYRYPDAERLLQEYGYSVSENCYVADRIELGSRKYDCIRIMIDYIQQPEDKYIHKENYFYFYDLETGELFQILHYDVGESDVGVACDFLAYFEDISFDGKEDLLIYQGDGGASSYYRAYIWTEDGFQYEETFDRIGSYELEEETKSIIGFFRMGAGGYGHNYFRYEQNGFIEYRIEINMFGRVSIDDRMDGEMIVYKEIKDKDMGIETYVFQIGETEECYRIDVKKTGKEEEYKNWVGNVYEIRLYSSETSEDVIQTISILGEEELKIYLEDLSFDGYRDLGIC